MKSTFLIAAMLLVALYSSAQDLTLTFNGSGAATTVDNVIALNQSTKQEVTVAGNTLLLQSVINSSENAKETSGAKIWPNPFTESVNFEFYLKKSCETTISVYNTVGQKVANSVQYSEAGKNQLVFNAGESGLYHFQIITSDKTYRLSALCKGGSNTLSKIRFIGTTSIKDVKESQLKSAKGDTYLSYTPGDRILFKVTSGNYVTIITDIPNQNKAYDVTFVNCSDADNNHYAALQIGTQIWFAENLKTTKYNDNTSIPLVTDATAWYNTTTPAFCYYGNDQITNKIKYGALYNWYSIDTASNGNKNVCPVGWHVPSDNNWAIMENYLIANGFNYDGTVDNDGDRNTNNRIGKSLSTITSWINNYDITGSVSKPDYPEKRNSSGFSALPGGGRIGMYFYSIGEIGYWWTTTSYDTNKAWFRYIDSGGVSIYRNNDKSRGTGFSVRCIKD
jgi:uncharacterized protein (TIGR02145 family)